jgi:hypothetical protein
LQHPLNTDLRTRLKKGELSTIAANLVAATGYSEHNIELELELVSRSLESRALRRNVDSSVPGGAASVDKITPIGGKGHVRAMPAGPVLIIASGNSIIPGLIPSALSLAMGNLTLLKPSATNYDALIKVFEPLTAMATTEPAAALMSEAIAITYFHHDSPRLRHLLEKGDLGVVNYWGGEPGLTKVLGQVAQNPHHPRFFSNGPLTGAAVVSRSGASEGAARGLAHNMVLYEQQLCSSPTIGAFVGTAEEAVGFAHMVAAELDSFGSQHPVATTPDGLFIRASSLRVMELKGSVVLWSKDLRNPWSLVVSESNSKLADALLSFPGFGFHGRRRFLELVIVDDLLEAAKLISAVPTMKGFEGIDKVQTVGFALGEEERALAEGLLAAKGIYRAVPVEDMYIRDPEEPYDGMFLASLFSYGMYCRR